MMVATAHNEPQPQPSRITSRTKKEMRNLYGISKDTFRKWMRLAAIEITNDHYLTPDEVRRFMDHHGRPEE